MAKLSARGRQELFRLAKTTTDANTLGPDISMRCRTFAFMTDGHILKKDQVRFVATQYSRGGLHDWGWQDQGKIGEARFQDIRQDLISRGFSEA